MLSSKFASLSAGIATFAVCLAALAVSWWSLDALGIRYGLPPALALIVSATLDGVAVVSASHQRSAALRGDGAALARLTTLAFASASAWLNTQHAALSGHASASARTMYAVPPIAAVLVLELSGRAAHRERLRQLGRTPAALPVLGALTWALHGGSAWRTLSDAVLARLALARASADLPALALSKHDHRALAERAPAVSAEVLSTPALSAEQPAGEQRALSSAERALALEQHITSALSAASAELQNDPSAQRSASASAEQSSEQRAERQRPAGARSSTGSKASAINDALEALGIGPEVDVPAVHAWIMDNRPGTTVGDSTIRARLRTARQEQGQTSTKLRSVT